jgi:hypothetical protein
LWNGCQGQLEKSCAKSPKIYGTCKEGQNIPMPGCLSVMDKVDKDLLRFIGRTSNSILQKFEEEVFCGGGGPPFSPETKERELL